MEEHPVGIGFAAVMAHQLACRDADLAEVVRAECCCHGYALRLTEVHVEQVVGLIVAAREA